jgi:hypothetical protein
MPMSLLFYRRPTNPAWTISGTGAQFESDVRLSDGNPGVLTSFRWLSEVSPVIGNFVALRGDWAEAITVRGAWAIALSLESGAFPVGVKFEIRGKRAGDTGYPYALGGNSLTEVSREMPDGSLSICWRFDEGLDPLVGIEIRIFNDAAGATWADADTYVRIGEADAAEGVAVCVAPGWSLEQLDQTEEQRTRGSQLHEVERVNYRAVDVTLAPGTGDEAFRQGLDTGSDWQRINAYLTRAFARAMVYIRTEDSSGVFSSIDLHATALFGRARPQRIAHVTNSRDRYTAGWRVEEVPAIV